ncbi:MAG TPA: hypothetical protein VK783_02965 [Bacteroidia bacterium]|jgi:hypothetical protein|nr:hypothetical protein [Bacteroidia bacterium]
METNHSVIQEADVKAILADSIPELHIEKTAECTLCNMLDRFADYTIDLIKKGNLAIISDCFNAAGQLHEEGSAEVKNAIENVYVFSITIFFDMAHATSKQVKELLPACLMKEYRKQATCSHP